MTACGFPPRCVAASTYPGRDHFGGVDRPVPQRGPRARGGVDDRGAAASSRPPSTTRSGSPSSEAAASAAVGGRRLAVPVGARDRDRVRRAPRRPARGRGRAPAARWCARARRGAASSPVRRGSTRVSGPGQNRSATGVDPGAGSASVERLRRRRAQHRDRHVGSPPLQREQPLDAPRRRGRAASPYTVSVGSTTTPAALGAPPTISSTCATSAATSADATEAAPRDLSPTVRLERCRLQIRRSAAGDEGAVAAGEVGLDPDVGEAGRLGEGDGRRRPGSRRSRRRARRPARASRARRRRSPRSPRGRSGPDTSAPRRLPVGHLGRQRVVGGDVGRVADDHVDAAAQLVGQRGEPVALDQPDHGGRAGRGRPGWRGRRRGRRPTRRWPTPRRRASARRRPTGRWRPSRCRGRPATPPGRAAASMASPATTSVSGRGISTRRSTKRSRVRKPHRPSTYCSGSPAGAPRDHLVDEAHLALGHRLVERRDLLARRAPAGALDDPAELLLRVVDPAGRAAGRGSRPAAAATAGRVIRRLEAAAPARRPPARRSPRRARRPAPCRACRS